MPIGDGKLIAQNRKARHDYSLIDKANEEICQMVKKEATSTLNKVLLDASTHMKCNYNRADN